MVKPDKTEEKHEAGLKQKVKRLYGNKCPDFEKDCACCQAWYVCQTIIDENRGKI